jgi:hypothetical protein
VENYQMQDELIKIDGKVCRVLEVEVIDRADLVNDIQGSKDETARLEARLAALDAFDAGTTAKTAPADSQVAPDSTAAQTDLPPTDGALAPASDAAPADAAPADGTLAPTGPAAPETNATEPASAAAEFEDLPATPADSPTHVFPI